MKGVFHPGDLMVLEQVSINDLSKGDVVVFECKNDNDLKNNLVHRVISISKEGLITRGDNNKFEDNNPVTTKNFVGKVEKFKRNGKTYKVRGGLSGLYLAKLKYFLRRSIFSSYKKITKFSFIRSTGKLLLNNKFKNIKKIELNSKDSQIIKWVLNGKTIAQKGPKKDYFYVKKPYDLIIEKQKRKDRQAKQS